MNWIKVRTALSSDPAVWRIASTLDLNRDEVLGKLLRFWAWCSDHCATPTVEGVGLDYVDEIVGFSGFAAELVEVGWLIAHKGGIEIPNFDRHLSKSAKSRGLNTERQARSRNGRASVAQSARVEKRREEKRREEKISIPLPSPLELPLPQTSPPAPIPSGWGVELKDAWQAWLSHQGEVGSPLTPTAAGLTIEELSTMSEAQAVAAIKLSIRKRWKSIYPSMPGTEPSKPRPIEEIASEWEKGAREAQAKREARKARKGKPR